MQVPSELRYTETHEWADKQDDGVIRVGITEHAQELLGDMVFVELPEINLEVESGGECVVLESVKAAADVYAPVSGEIVEVNEQLLDNPSLVNTDPYGEGWLFQIRPMDEAMFDELIDADTYQEMIEG